MKDIDSAVIEFIKTAKKALLSREVYEDGWNAKEIIAHIVYYHEYYSRVVKAIADGEKELPLIDESLAKVNLYSAKEYSGFSRDELISRFKAAHKLLMESIERLDSSTEIPYKKGGRIYLPEEYLSEIAGHIKRHTRDLS